jgi:hypothetical protein
MQNAPTDRVPGIPPIRRWWWLPTDAQARQMIGDGPAPHIVFLCAHLRRGHWPPKSGGGRPVNKVTCDMWGSVMICARLCGNVWVRASSAGQGTTRESFCRDSPRKSALQAGYVGKWNLHYQSPASRAFLFKPLQNDPHMVRRPAGFHKIAYPCTHDPHISSLIRHVPLFTASLPLCPQPPPSLSFGGQCHVEMRAPEYDVWDGPKAHQAPTTIPVQG